MDKKRNKTILLNSLIFVFCVVIIILYCLVPPAKKPEVAKLQTYQVVFDTDGGTIISSVSVEEGHSIEAPPTPTKEGYIFDGWVVDDVSYDFSQIISGDVVLKARWREVAPDTVIYTVRFETEGGTTYPEQFIEENGKVVQPSEPVRDGYKFVEWQVDGNPYNFDNPVTSNLTIVAKWEEEDENKTYTVTFDLNGGTGSKPANQTIKTGERASVPSERPTRDKYRFLGWSTNRNASSPNIEAVTIRNDTTFYALWQSTVKTYTVTINLDGGSGCGSSQKVEEGGHPTGCTNITKPNHTFAHWTSGGRDYSRLDQITVNSDISVYAVWNQNQQYSYTLTYNYGIGGSGNCSSPQTYTGYETSHSFNLCTPSAPTFYTFNGWYNGNNKVNNPYTMNANGTNNGVTLTAHYDAARYTVSCSINEGTTHGDSVTCNTSISPSDSSLVIVSSGTTMDKGYAFGTPMQIATYSNTSNLKICKSNSLEGKRYKTCVDNSNVTYNSAS